MVKERKNRAESGGRREGWRAIEEGVREKRKVEMEKGRRVD